MSQWVLNYLGATAAERLNPALESFIGRATQRVDRAMRSGAGFAVLVTLVEAWLVANHDEQPLWPKDGGPILREPMDVFGASLPEWQKRKWV